MCITGTFILLMIVFVGVSDYIEIQSRVIKNKLKNFLKLFSVSGELLYTFGKNQDH